MLSSLTNIFGHLFSALLLTYLLTYLLTPRCRVLEKLTGLQQVKEFPAFHGTRRFITALKSVRHLSLSWASPIQSIYPHPISWRSILILSTHLRLGLPSGQGYIYEWKKNCDAFRIGLIVMWPTGVECQMTNEAFFIQHTTLEGETTMLSGNFR
jgi:hypothetical protein